MRLKLVATNEARGHELIDEFEHAADLLRRLFPTEAAVIMMDIKARQKFSREIGGIRLRFFDEQLVPGAFNLMIEARCDKFQCQARNSYYKLSEALEEMPKTPELETNATSQQE